MLFLWVLTWFSYGLFMKNQINIINVTGAVVSASLMVLLYFLPSLNAFYLSNRRNISKTQKAQILPHKDEKTPQPTTEIKTQKQETECIKLADKIQQLPLTNQILPHKDEKIPPQIFEIKTQKQETESIKQPEPIKQTTLPKTQKQKPKVSQQITEIKTQKQELECIKLADTPQQIPLKSNGCPKNLDYYTKKPRPKQTPEECITCKKLIDCVCLTSN